MKTILTFFRWLRSLILKILSPNQTSIPMSTIKYAYFQRSLNDEVVSVGTTTYGISCSDMPGTYGEFTIEADEDDVDDLCIELDETTDPGEYNMTLIDKESNEYPLAPQAFVEVPGLAGRRPPHRPPHKEVE